MNMQELIELENTYMANNYRPLDVVLVRGKGCWVWDLNGNKYLDFLAAYSALNQGYVHPRIFKALVRQAKLCTLTSRAFRNDQLPILARKMCQLFGYENMIPMNSGAEAVETALKVARMWGHSVKGIPMDEAEIIVCSENFHGRTISIISFSSEDDYRIGFGPHTPGFKLIKFGDAVALEKAITPKTAAFFFEPIQGEAGINVPPPGYLKAVRDICTRNNILMVADEIQSGLGRTGKLLACQWENARADMVCLGKALSGGFIPVSAVMADRSVLGVLKPGSHGSTFGGNPLAAAVAIASLDVLVDEKLVERSAELGDYLMAEVKKIQSSHIAEIRGKGLWIGIELKPSAGGARQFCEKLKNRGLLCKETHTHIIRLAPPLVVKKAELDWAVAQLKAVLET